jgi:cysteinyl-tRNA synthetase
MNDLKIYNTLSRTKEVFTPLAPPYVGMYVCGPTVYGDAHLGHGRSAITFDVLFRYLKYKGYKVRYVRNITDVGHLEQDADHGDDKIAKKARLEKLEPMEVVQRYTDAYHQMMSALNVLPPSIEPRASGHIPEQIEMTTDIIKQGFAYESQGSVYFDVEKYNKDHHYGKLSGRIVEDMLSGTRELEGQEGKRSSLDFALWKKASPEHIMQWESPWSKGFPGWHLECSAMSAKYLGKTFDIHGGGMDLMFPHHECEIAQSQAGNRVEPAKYWVHNNMITINGQKMGKSLGNFITLEELFSGKHDLLEHAYSPMTVRFFILQAQYRSTLDFSNDALVAARKGYRKMMNGLRALRTIQHPNTTATIDAKQEEEVKQMIEECFVGLDDDLNTAMTIASLFNLLKKINAMQTGQLNPGSVSIETYTKMKQTFETLLTEVLGLKEENDFQTEELFSALLDIYKEAKANKEYDKVDKMRAIFKQQGVLIKDMKTGVDWSYEE